MSRFGRSHVIGRAGRGPTVLGARRLAGHSAVLVAALVVVAGGVVVAEPWPVLAGAATAVFVWRRLRSGVARARAGAESERLVAGRLRRAGAEVVVYGARDGGRGDIDVVVLGPMAAAIEVKRGSGRVRVRADGSVSAGGRRLPGTPARQALGAAARVRRRLPEVDFVDAVLCIDRMRGRSRWVDVAGRPLVVCSAARLPRLLRRLPRRLEPGAATRLESRFGGSRRSPRDEGLGAGNVGGFG